MSKSISEINKRLRELNKKYKKSGLTDGKISQKAAMAALAGTDRLKMSEEAKNKISNALSKKPKTKEHIEKLKKTKLKYKITKKQIQEAQKLYPYAKDVAKHLGMDFHTYKRIAEEKGCYKSVSLSNRNKNICSKKIIATNLKTEKSFEFNSIADASKKLNVAATNIVAVCKGRYKQCKGFYFEYK